MRFPCDEIARHPATVTGCTPSQRLPEIRLPATADRPAYRVTACFRNRFRRRCIIGRQRWCPYTSVPILFPATTLKLCAEGDDLDAVETVLPEITFPSIGGRRHRRIDADPVGRGTFGEEDAVAGDAQRTSPGHVGADEVARDDVAVGPVAVDVDAVVVCCRRSRSARRRRRRSCRRCRSGCPEAPAAITTPPPKISQRVGDRLRAVVQGDRSEMSVPMKLPATTLLSCPVRRSRRRRTGCR